jgi:methyl-accepting chemotaxis protein PixJ
MNKPQPSLVAPTNPGMTYAKFDAMLTYDEASALDRLRKFVQNHLIGTITVTITTSLVLGGLSTWNIWRIYNNSRSTINEQFALEKLSGKIVHLDEVLTMSARMAASTGDLSWEKRYNQYVPELDQAIKTTLAKVPESIQAEAAKTDDANAKLVEMETRAFALVQKGKSREAAQILSGEDYKAQKAVYSEGNERVLKQIEQFIKQQLTDYQEQLQISIVTAAIILPIVLASWLLVLSAVQAYIRERRVSQATLEASRSELMLLADNLQQEATLRQEKEQQILSESEVLQADIEQLLDAVSSVEEGDLTIQAPVSDRVTGLVSDTLNRLIEELGAVIFQVLGAARQVSHNTQALEAIAGKVSNNAMLQADSVAEALTLSGQVEQSAIATVADLQRSNQTLRSLNQTVQEGQSAIRTLTQGTATLQQGTDQIIQQMKTLGEFVGLAEQFVQDQNQIATQTQILALNASLVAARAAEQKDPRKFAIAAQEFEAIAEQVGQLAQQTNEGLASLEQRTLQIQNVVSSVDAEVQGLGSLVSGFTQGVDQSNEAFNSVQTVTTTVVQTGEQIAQSSQSIIDRAQSTATAMKAIVNLAEKTTQLTQAVRKQSESMGQSSTQLLQRVEFFRLPSANLPESPLENAAPHSANPV